MTLTTAPTEAAAPAAGAPQLRRRPGSGEPGPEPASRADLTGFSVVLTADRRWKECAAILQRRGVRVLHAPTIRVAPLEDDAGLWETTDRVIENPPEFVLITTAAGFRGWLGAADAIGVGDQLRQVLADSRLIARGPKVIGAIRAAGLREEWSAPGETVQEAVDHLRGLAGPGSSVAVQLHGDPDPGWLRLLRRTPARIEALEVYRWLPSPNPFAVRQALDAVNRRRIDAVVFTSAPAATAFLASAGEHLSSHRILDELRRRCTVASVGSVTSEPLRLVGIEPVQPPRARLGSLARTVIAALESRVLSVELDGGRSLRIVGCRVLVDGTDVAVSPTVAGFMACLARHPGVTVSSTELRQLAARSDTSDLALSMTARRARRALGDEGTIRAVPGRGYRMLARPA